jgi:hypothetical protein
MLLEYRMMDRHLKLYYFRLGTIEDDVCARWLPMYEILTLADRANFVEMRSNARER